MKIVTIAFAMAFEDWAFDPIGIDHVADTMLESVASTCGAECGHVTHKSVTIIDHKDFDVLNERDVDFWFDRAYQALSIEHPPVTPWKKPETPHD